MSQILNDGVCIAVNIFIGPARCRVTDSERGGEVFLLQQARRNKTVESSAEQRGHAPLRAMRMKVNKKKATVP